MSPPLLLLYIVHSEADAGNPIAKVTLIRGLMSALSAGMLIYASCVEMLAGDFVLDPHLWRSSVRRQACALVSLLAGCVAMGVVG